MVCIKNLREDVVDSEVEINGEVIHFKFHPDFLTAEESANYRNSPYIVAAESIAANVTEWDLEEELKNDEGELVDKDGKLLEEGAEPVLVLAPLTPEYCRTKLPTTITMAIYNQMWEEISPN